MLQAAKQLKLPSTLHLQTVCALEYHSAGELVRLLKVYTGYNNFGFQTHQGNCKGTFVVGVGGPHCCTIAYTVSQRVLISGLRNKDVCVFAAAPPINDAGRDEALHFWKNMQLPANLLGGFCLSEEICHYSLSPNSVHLLLIVDRSKVMARLEEPKNRQVLNYMHAANSCVLPDRLYERFIDTVLLSTFHPPVFSAKGCPVQPIFELLNDASYAHALPSKQFLPSSQQFLLNTRGITEHIFEGINVGELGEIVGLGRTQLNNACQEVYECSPKEFMRKIRLEESMLLLRSPAERSLLGLNNIVDVHNHVGIVSSSSFRKLFFEWFGSKPSDHWVS